MNLDTSIYTLANILTHTLTCSFTQSAHLFQCNWQFFKSKMQLYLYILVALCVSLSHGYSANKPYPSLAPCSQDVIAEIKEYWKTEGIPHDVLKRMEHKGSHTLYHTSYDYHNSGNKCIYMKTTDGVMNFTFIPKNGDTPARLTYSVEQGDDEIIKGKPLQNDTPELRWKWYPVSYSNGVAVCYACGDFEGAVEPPVVAVMVANNNHNRILTKALVDNGMDLIRGWGQNFKYSYGPECHTDE